MGDHLSDFMAPLLSTPTQKPEKTSWTPGYMDFQLSMAPKYNGDTWSFEASEGDLHGADVEGVDPQAAGIQICTYPVCSCKIFGKNAS
jgi:hypothetical protein